MPRVTIEYPADIIWGFVAKAQAVNGRYIKQAIWDVDDEGNPVRIKDSNRELVHDWIENNLDPESEHIEKGREYRQHITGYTFLALAGKLNDFQLKAMQIAAKDIWTMDRYELAILCSLPDAVERDRKNKDLMDIIRQSTQMTNDAGDKIEGSIEVLKNSFSFNYNTNFVTARLGESVVEFFSKNEFVVGNTYNIKAKIKKHLDNKKTRLNYVKLVG